MALRRGAAWPAWTWDHSCRAYLPGSQFLIAPRELVGSTATETNWRDKLLSKAMIHSGSGAVEMPDVTVKALTHAYTRMGNERHERQLEAALVARGLKTGRRPA